MNRPLRRTPTMPLPPKPFAWKKLWLALAGLALLAVGLWLASFLFTHTAWQARVAGQSVGLKTEAEVLRAVNKQAAQLKVVFSHGGRAAEPTLDELGVQVNHAKTVRHSMQAASGWQWLQPWRAAETPLAIEVDEAQLQNFLQANFAEIYQPPTQPSLRFNERREAYEALSGQPGTGFDAAVVAAQIKALAYAPTEVTIASQTEPVPPSITNEAAAGVADAATFRLHLRLNFMHQNKLVYFPESAEIAAWQQVQVSGDGTTLELTYDKTKIISFLKNSVTESLNTFFGPGGSEAITSAPLVISDADALAEDIILTLQNAQPFEKELSVQPQNQAAS